ncbi:MAG: flagellar export protein FliJ [Gemmatimonadaceae bacterium]
MFKFPLQRLLELREQREQEMALELARARDTADFHHQQLSALTSARIAAQASVSRATGETPTVGQIVSLSFVVAQLGERASAAFEQATAADEHVNERREALTSAAQDRQILDRLRTRRLDEYRADAAQIERATMDAIALTRHVHNATDDRKENKA